MMDELGRMFSRTYPMADRKATVSKALEMARIKNLAHPPLARIIHPHGKGMKP